MVFRLAAPLARRFPVREEALSRSRRGVFPFEKRRFPIREESAPRAGPLTGRPGAVIWSPREEKDVTHEQRWSPPRAHWRRRHAGFGADAQVRGGRDPEIHAARPRARRALP